MPPLPVSSKCCSTFHNSLPDCVASWKQEALLFAPGGGYSLVYGHVYAPFGLTRVFSYADATFLVPEYVETNNWDSIP